MITLVPNADSIIKRLFYENSVIAYYHSACERYTNGYVNTFITDMQTLVTKLGVMMSAIAEPPKTKVSYCEQSIRYLCCEVLDNPRLVEKFDEIGLNEKGNKNKHSIAKNVNIDMLKCVTAYNNLVMRISDKYGLKSIENMIVKKVRDKKTSDKTSDKTISSSSNQFFLSNKSNTNADSNKKYVDDCFAEKNSVKYTLLGKNRIELRLSPNYSFDEYTKVATTQITLFWEDCSDERLEIIIENSKTKKQLVHEHISLNNLKKKNYPLHLKETDISNSTVKLSVKLKLLRKKKKDFQKCVMVTKGKIFKRTVPEMQEYTQLVEYVAQEKTIELTNTLDRKL